MEYLNTLFEGLQNNLIITFFSAIFPLVIGILISLPVRKSEKLGTVFSWLKLPFECVSIPVLLVMIYFMPGLLFNSNILNDIDAFFQTSINPYNSSRIIIAIIAISITHLFYLPARYNHSFSFLKNALYNGLGLISNIFKWSLVSGFINSSDMLQRSINFASMEGVFWPLALTITTTSLILVVIEIARLIIKNKMK